MHRQRHPNGNEELLKQLAAHFSPLKIDDFRDNSEQGFKEFLYLTQVRK
jgi:hypothetical protein